MLSCVTGAALVLLTGSHGPAVTPGNGAALMSHQGTGVPQLVLIAPDSYRGHRIELATEYMTVGREPTCDVRLDDPHVSRTHAALQRRGDSVYVQDLGSSGGTFVNGNRATTAQLQHGDIVAFATVQARFEARPPVGEQTHGMPAYAGQVETEQAPAAPPRAAAPRAIPPHATPKPAGQVNYSIGQQGVQRRDSFLRDIAATKTKARWLIWLGLLLFLAGFALFGAADLDFIRQIGNGIQSGTAPTSSPFGHDIAGVPYGLIGAGVAAIGMVMFIIGIALHVVATSRRKRVERDLPLPPPPWQQYGPPGRAG